MSKSNKKAKPEGSLFSADPGTQTSVNREPRASFTVLFDSTLSVNSILPSYVSGATRMLDECGKHPVARSSAYASVNVCGPEFNPTPYQPFSKAVLPEFTLLSGSPGGMWLKKGVGHLRAEHERMKADAVTVNKDVFLLLSDFHFTDGGDAFDAAVEAYRELEKEPQFTGLMVMVGDRPNRALASRVSRKRPPVHLNELRVGELFDWLSIVIQSASMSQPGQPAEVPTPTWMLNDGPR